MFHLTNSTPGQSQLPCRDPVHHSGRELALYRDPPMVRLAASDQQEDGEVVSYSNIPIVIGRSPTVDLHVTDRWVSRLQCAIQPSGDEFSIRDLESRHGTFVNEQQVSFAKLHDGDVIRIGLTLLTVNYPN